MADDFSTDKIYHPESLEAELDSYHDEPLIRVVMMPEHTNSMGTVFGGVILSHLDLAAGEESKRIGGSPMVTKVMREVEFVAPVEVGDWVSFYTRTEEIGETSVTARVLVVAQRGEHRNELYKVTEAEVVFVAVDENGAPRSIEE